MEKGFWFLWGAIGILTVLVVYSVFFQGSFTGETIEATQQAGQIAFANAPGCG